jgi:paraquat-inducible protein B|tara:strand:- start:350 stop:832 length:483 start_codon:yes stop_codon:yes gene_type:complete
MAEESIDLRKEVFNKAQYIKTINTSFDQFGATTINEDLKAQVTVEEFFGLYNSLFYDIPALGETNSHDYLVKTSGGYINFDEINEEVKALQAEIAQLRQDLLNAQMENIQQTAASSNDPVTDALLKQTNTILNTANAQIVETNTTLEENTPTSINNGGSY